jgi:hypothetical protein
LLSLVVGVNCDLYNLIDIFYPYPIPCIVAAVSNKLAPAA